MKLRLTVVAATVVALAATAFSGPAVASPSAADSPGTTACWPSDRPHFRVGTHNTWHGKATFTRFAGIIGWQEVDSSGARTKMRNQLGDKYRHFVPTAGPAKSNSISWRRAPFAFLRGRAIKVHDGRAKVTPARYINVVHLRHRTTGRKIVFINTHFISGAFREGSTYTAWRKARWYEHRDRLKQLIRTLRDHYPHRPIYLVGDFNRHGYIYMDGLRVYPIRLGTRKPIDQIYAGRPGRGACLERLTRKGSDHHRWRASVWY